MFAPLECREGEHGKYCDRDGDFEEQHKIGGSCHMLVAVLAKEVHAKEALPMVSVLICGVGGSVTVKKDGGKNIRVSSPTRVVSSRPSF